MYIHKIGSWNGGGLMGIGAIKFMLMLNRDSTNKMEYDGYTGTSTGAIIAGAMAIDMPMVDLYHLYMDIGKSVFKHKSWLPNRPKYKRGPLEKALRNGFGEILLSELDKSIFIPYSDFHTGQVRVFDRSDSIPLWYAVLVSCSAPSYFPPVEGCYCDGGLIANNPSLIGATGYSREMDIPLSQISVMNYDTNGKMDTDIPISSGMLLPQIAISVFKFVMGASEGITSFYCNQVGLHSYLLLQPKLTRSYPMDDTRTLHEYPKVWENYYNQVKNDVFLYMSNIKQSEEDV